MFKHLILLQLLIIILASPIQNDKVNITVTNCIFNAPCEHSGSPIEFQLEVTKSASLRNDITNIIVQIEGPKRLILEAFCNLTAESTTMKCIASGLATNIGEYTPFMPVSFISEEYIINTFKCENSIFASNYYTKPVSTELTFESDYSERDLQSFAIEFEDKLEDRYRIPRVFYGDTFMRELKCYNIDGNLECGYTENEFPINKEDPTVFRKYKLSMKNVCGMDEVEIELGVKKTPK